MRYFTGLGLILLGCVPSARESGLVLEVCGGVVSILGVGYFLGEVVDRWNQT